MRVFYQSFRIAIAGILTGIAAIIAAVGGIYIAINQQNNNVGIEPSPVATQPSPTKSSPVATQPPPTKSSPVVTQPPPTKSSPIVTQPPPEKTFDNPNIKGVRLNDTTWNFPGGDASAYRKKAADLFCQYSGYSNSSRFGFEDLGPNQKLQRFWDDGTLEKCDFCAVPFTYITCR